MIVPALTPVPDHDLDAHAAAHAALAAAYTSAGRPTQLLFTMLQRRLAIESLAHVQPVSDVISGTQLVPAPRAFLTVAQQRRLDGAEAAFRHIDVRGAMVLSGAKAHPIESSTPEVLNALMQGPLSSARETNAGILRATPTSWRLEANPYRHPAAESVPELVAAAIDFATTAPAPACARAGWLTFTMLSIHPFVDGNGRTARALCMALTGATMPLAIDWGVLEQWSLDRVGYVEALQAGQQVDTYRPDDMDAGPFVRFSIATSTLGAEVCRARLAAIGGAFERTRATGLDDDQATVVVAVDMLRGASRRELDGVMLGHDATERTIASLCASGRCAWTPRPHSRRTVADPDAWRLVSV